MAVTNRSNNSCPFVAFVDDALWRIALVVRLAGSRSKNKYYCSASYVAISMKDNLMTDGWSVR